MFGVQNVIPLMNTAVPDKAQQVLNAISKALDTSMRTSLNARVQLEKEGRATVAKDWLTRKSLI